MKLPNAENASVADAKLTEYLLSTTHPEGKDKAVIFYSRGFSIGRLGELRTALKEFTELLIHLKKHGCSGGYSLQKNTTPHKSLLLKDGLFQ
jgi:hypothetical protein